MAAWTKQALRSDCASRSPPDLRKNLAAVRYSRTIPIHQRRRYRHREENQLASLLVQGLISASSCMIGDRAVDIMAAKANRLISAGVLWGHGSLRELQEAAPDFLLSSPRQLLAHAQLA
ncbi:MAG TPA: HAD hydrolase-like protein [Casimicrobiaceae bacterium]